MTNLPAFNAAHDERIGEGRAREANNDHVNGITQRERWVHGEVVNARISAHITHHDVPDIERSRIALQPPRTRLGRQHRSLGAQFAAALTASPAAPTHRECGPTVVPAASVWSAYIESQGVALGVAQCLRLNERPRDLGCTVPGQRCKSMCYRASRWIGIEDAVHVLSAIGSSRGGRPPRTVPRGPSRRAPRRVRCGLPRQRHRNPAIPIADTVARTDRVRPHRDERARFPAESLRRAGPISRGLTRRAGSPCWRKAPSNKAPVCCSPVCHVRGGRLGTVRSQGLRHLGRSASVTPSNAETTASTRFPKRQRR